ncbi:hypothetical protein BS47DRAFT_1355281 [Hydnum rufescens UP504]|uniref:4-coumarate-CoA ligase n=1 Tax=Hydnum rufescens UP504 TaxID=1448309 RepID=A0A9P6DGW9_9AGAM|nr:hypothetical protein BS47DRAFT_1355281 [Hydnum rufescens UP504]
MPYPIIHPPQPPYKASLDDSPAYIDALSDVRISRFQTYDLSLRLAMLGDVAMIFSPNSLAWPPTFFGLIAAGLRPTLANSFYTPPELAHQIKDSRAKMIFVHPTLFPILIETFRVLGVSGRERVHEAAKIGHEWTRLSEFFGTGRLPSEELFDGDQANETALLCYSSGTTGLSKGVETTHQNVVSLNSAFFGYIDLPDAKTDVSGAILPFYHILLVVVLLWDFRFCLVPPILVAMSFHPAFDKYDMSTLKFICSGAAPLGESLVTKVLARFNRKGYNQLTITQGYGLTETSPVTHWLRGQDSIRKRGSIGRLLPNVQARLVDDDEKDIQPGPENSGELWVRGPNIMKGYLNNPTATKNSITPDGWFKTGDIAIMDDEGYFSIVDRKKELIKYKGFQVPPADLEAVLLSREDILDAAVIGVESVEEATELPRAYVVASRNDELLKDPKAAAAFAKAIQEWMRTKVASHKFLRGGVIITDCIPKTGSGKILRRTLRELAAKDALRRIRPRL